MVDRPLCEICGKKPAEFVCKDCGRLVCRDDFDPVLWVCKECRKKYIDYYPDKVVETSESRRKKEIWKPTLLFISGIILLFLGFAILIYPETGIIYMTGNLPMSPELLILLLTLIVYPVLLLIILLVFIKYFWMRTLS